MGAKRLLNKVRNTDTKKILLLRQTLPKKLLFFSLRFDTLYEQKFSNLKPLLSITFPQGFQISKNIGYRAAEIVSHCIANKQIAFSSSYIISFNHFFPPLSHVGLFDTFDKTFTTFHWLLIKSKPCLK